VFRELLRRRRARRAAAADSRYGHATEDERRALSELKGRFVRDPGGYSDAAEREMDRYFEAAEGRPSDDL
jgi:hypothetical protein